MEVETMAAEEQEPQQKPRPWGFWATVGFSLVIGAAYLLCSVIYGVGFVLVAKLRDHSIDIEEYARSFASSGLFLASLNVVLLGPVVGLILLFSRMRGGMTTTEYLCLRNPGVRKLAAWLLFILGYGVLADMVTYFSGGQIVHEFLIGAYETAYFEPLLWLGFVVAAPIIEELFFRGFFFKGIECSRFGPVGAIVLAALGWSVLHTQYEVFYVAATFVGGLILGWARLRTQSVYVPIVMHMAWNLVATVQVTVYARRA
ncbi:MAG: lysostaphin resistance A-like protein [Planctomycetota bacterium]|jgi:membrane protease YdiL (CAAX protease family)